MPVGPYADEILGGFDQIAATVSVPVEPLHRPIEAQTHIRLSEIGYCARRIGYKLLRTVEKRKSRGTGLTFATGNFFEALVLESLRLAGLTVVTHQPDSGAQVEVTIADTPVVGHLDATAILDERAPDPWVGVNALVEVKSANDRRFREMVKQGVRASDPVYFAQMQSYMDGQGLPVALYVAVSKATPDVYTEIVPADPIVQAALRQKARLVWNTTRAGELPPPDYHRTSVDCKWCPFFGAPCDGGEWDVEHEFVA